MKQITMRSNKICTVCGRKIYSGENAFIESYVKEKFYPVKGIMRFVNYHFTHFSCGN